jgi:RHS repeat-associated protein
LVTSALVAAAAPVVLPTARAAADTPVAGLGAAEVSRPDAVSAGVAARVSGSRVRVTGLSTASSSTWVNPDGTFSTDLSSVPVQAEVSARVWQPLDETLSAGADGSVAPAVSVTAARFGKAGSSAAARLGSGVSATGLDWLSPLPAPVLSGDTATYPNVLAGTDLTATATATGFELSLVVKAKPTAALPGSVTMPLRGTGLTWSLSSAGVLVGKNAAGAVVVTSSGARAYDSSLDPHTGDPVHSVPLALSLSGAVGAQKLTVAIPAALLSDPGTVFPVTIDPSASWAKSAWTYVDSGYSSTSYYNANDVARVGTYDSGSHADRSLFQFGTYGLHGKHILAATISLNETWSWSCTARAFDIWSVGAFSSSTTWANQPALYTRWATITSAKGYSSACPAGNVTADVTAWAVAAAGNSNTYNDLELRSPSETDNTYWKKFNPAVTVSVSYNSYPGTAAGKSVKPCSAVCTGTVLTNSVTPKLTGVTSDADGGTLRYDFEVWAGSAASPTTRTTYGSVSGVSSGATATWTVPAAKLVNGSTYEYRVRAFDGTDYGPWSTGWTVFTVDTSAPVAPVISSTTHPAGTWTSATTGTFSWTDASTDKYLYAYKLDSGAWSAWATATSHTFTAMANNVEHTVSVQVNDKAGNISAAGTYVFGVGTGGLTSPADQDRTQSLVTLSAVGPPSFPYVKYRYRRGTTVSFADVPLSDLKTPSGGTGPTAWPTPIGASWVWNVLGLPDHSDGLIQLQACLYTSTTDTTPTCQATPVNLQLAVKTFGASYATAPIGPGTVSLATGDFSVSATDVNVPSYLGDLSLSRSFTTLAPTGEIGGATGVFGPGWTAALTGPDAGAGDLRVTDQSANGYFLLTDSDGGSSLYKVTAVGATTYTGVGDANDGSVLTKTDATHISLKDTDGTVTSWTFVNPAWQVQTIVEPGSASTTTYTYTNNLVTRILGAVPAGVTTCATAPDATAGCRSLVLTYGTVAGHTRLTTVALSAPPTSVATTPTPVAAYNYDSTGMLTGAYDPRISPNLVTAYTYDSNGRLATVTPPGLAAWTMHYDSTGCASTPPALSCGRLTSVTRPDGAQTATSSVVYGLPLSGTGAPTGLDLSATTAGTWGQDSDLPQPNTGTAVFGPDHAPATPLTSADWPFADLTYRDVNGRAVDTASYGAGNWQIASTRYDSNGNPVWSLDAGNRAQALTPTDDTDPGVAAQAASADRADLLATLTTYNTDPTVLGGDSTVVVDTLGPQHPVQLADGTTVSARAHVHTDYNQGAPSTGGPYRLPTTITSTAQDSTGTEQDPRITRLGYAKIVAADAGEGDGWTLGQATTTTTDMGGASADDLVRTTRYNLAGQTIETRLPEAAAGGTAGDTITSYYTATGTGSCVSASQAGLECSTGPAAQPATGNPLPVTVTTYNSYDQPVTVTETAGTTVRTSTTSYDLAGRATGSSTTVTPSADGGTVLPDVTTTYDSGKGLPVTVSADGKTLTTGYDSLGRATSYIDATGNVSARTYDLSGRPVTVTDGKGTTSYTYDSATEHRGLVTAEDIGVGAAPGTFTADYDAAGNLATQTYPSGLTAVTSYDNAGNDTALTYAQGGVTWYGFTQTPGSDGSTATQTSPASSQQFDYDHASRLVTTRDTVPDPVNGTTCTTRTYGLTKNSNRTVLNTYPDDGSNPDDGHCTTLTTPTPVWGGTYDQADRLTNTGYSYDTLGRTLSVPAADATGIGSHAATTGDLTLGYYANDLVASQTQGGRTLGFTLDPAQNRVLDTTDTAGATSTNHYTDNGDSPAWTSTDAATWTRNITGPAGGLAATIDQTGTVVLQLANPHGDIIGNTADDPNATGPTSYSEATEYGAPRDPTTAPDTYGWLGTKQRSTNDLAGLTLMGIRLYNPTTGRFLSIDPVPGGNDNPYVYVTDPTDGFDLNGQWGCWKWKCVRHAAHYSYTFARNIVPTTVAVAVAWHAGGSCGMRYNLQIVCGGARYGYGRGGTTYGNTYITPDRWTSRSRLRHEYVHSRQWARYGISFGFRYFAAGLNPCRNRFEREAGLAAGGYSC